jgi:signal transduction histidine kinase
VEGVIEIRVEQARQEDHLRLTVEDNGCGIEASRLTTIFQRGESSKKSGSGFGLHSVATFVQSLNGSIRAESEGEGLGSAIIIEMPING